VIDSQAGVHGADVAALQAWQTHAGTSSVIVAIVGRGIDPHVEFEDRLLEGHAVLGDPYDTLDSCPHDTHLAGTIGASRNNNIGIAGLSAGVRLLPVRALEGCGGTEADTAAGITWAVDHGADIVLAAVQFTEFGQVLADAVAYAAANDVVVVAPAGSTGREGVAYPAALDGCLAVSATTNQDEISSHSNYGSAVNLAAPGMSVFSTWIDGGYAYMPEGRDTASASAFVVGVTALIRSYAPQLTAAEVTQVLLDTADDLGESGWDAYFGAGRVNAARALAASPPPPLRFEYIDRPPTVVPPAALSTFRIRIVAGSETAMPGQVSVIWRLGGEGEFQVEPLEDTGGGRYTVPLSPVPPSEALEYCLMATGTSGSVVVDPPECPNDPHTAYAAYVDPVFHDDFEEDLGWHVEGGDNTTGRWSRVAPIGTTAQPGFDRSPNEGTFCYVTGQHLGGHDGTNDVDLGPVLLTSPVIDLGTAGDAEIRYARWFHCSGSGTEDYLAVEVSRDGGSTWATAETVGGTDAWVTHSFRLTEFTELAGSRLRVRFSTQDDPNDSLTEAGVDEFIVRALRWTITPGDTNHDGAIDLEDAAGFVDCWRGPEPASLAGACVILDFNHDYRIDLRDFQAFQEAFGGS
jgi:hypothetical protein